ncbi:MAG: DUF2721 domain-containing protein [Novosphingobium sp.]
MIAHTIQLALTPVFVLVAIGNLLNLLSTRLGRIVDRARELQERHAITEGPAHDMVVAEMRLVDRRMALTHGAIRLLVLSGIAIGTTVTVLFAEEMTNYPLERVAATIFVIAIALLMAAMTQFLLETQVATRALSIPPDYLDDTRGP